MSDGEALYEARQEIILLSARVARVRELEAENASLCILLTEALDYMRHHDWRCEHKDRWPECVCGYDELKAKINAAIERKAGT